MAVDFNAIFKESNQFGAGFEANVYTSNVLPSDDLPLMDGEVKAGISKKYARGDHRHPHDSEKMDYMKAISNLELEAMLK